MFHTSRLNKQKWNTSREFFRPNELPHGLKKQNTAVKLKEFCDSQNPCNNYQGTSRLNWAIMSTACDTHSTVLIACVPRDET